MWITFKYLDFPLDFKCIQESVLKMAKLDDIFSASMKQPRKLLDLSNVKIESDDAFFKYMDKLPDLKLRPENVEPEDIQILTDCSFTISCKEQQYGSTTTSLGQKSKKCTYGDPMPPSMCSTRLEDLWALDIHWKMLTSDRPPNRLEEFYFERLVDLGRFSLTARKVEQATLKAIMSSIVGTPTTTYLIAMGFVTSRSKRGAMETRLKVCKKCGIELCTGAFCKNYHYEGYTRMILDKDELENQEQDKEELAFLKQVARAAGPSTAATAPSLLKKAKPLKKSLQGKKLKLQIRKTKRKKKKKKAKENLEPVSAPDE